MLTRRSFLLGGMAASAAVTLGRTSLGSVSRSLSLGELVYRSQHALVATPTERSSRWETFGRRERIVTYTVIRVEQALDGRTAPSRELLLRSLGGRVGDIGQIVPGEAVLRKNVPVTVFLEALDADLFGVTAMAQGSYPLEADSRGERRLRADAHALSEARTDAAAVRRLDGRTLIEAEALVYAEIARGR